MISWCPVTLFSMNLRKSHITLSDVGSLNGERRGVLVKWQEKRRRSGGVYGMSGLKGELGVVLSELVRESSLRYGKIAFPGVWRLNELKGCGMNVELVRGWSCVPDTDDDDNDDDDDDDDYIWFWLEKHKAFSLLSVPMRWCEMKRNISCPDGASDENKYLLVRNFLHIFIISFSLFSLKT
jgi:hypothetical protein